MRHRPKIISHCLQIKMDDFRAKVILGLSHNKVIMRLPTKIIYLYSRVPLHGSAFLNNSKLVYILVLEFSNYV